MTTNAMRQLSCFSLACALLVACGDDSSTGSSAGTGGDGAGSGGSGGSGGSEAPETVSLSGVVGEFALGLEPGMPGAPLSGVKVCVDGKVDIKCATTDADGAFTLKGLPPDIDIAYEFTKDGYFGVLLPGRTPKEDWDGFATALASDAVVNGFATILGTTYPNADQGVVTVFVWKQGDGADGGTMATLLPGATFDLVKGTGKGPNYVGENQVPDVKLTETTKGGWGFFYEVDPGTIEIEVSVDDLDCVGGWEGSGKNKFKAPIKANLQTNFSVTCK